MPDSPVCQRANPDEPPHFLTTCVRQSCASIPSVSTSGRCAGGAAQDLDEGGVLRSNLTSDVRKLTLLTSDIRCQGKGDGVALPDELADTLLKSIVDGQFPVESVLPWEGEFALKYGMSRFCDRRIRNDDALLDVVTTSRSA
jgi:hypothetical protein